VTTYCAPGALYRCSKCGTARTRPEYLEAGACRETEWCRERAATRLLWALREKLDGPPAPKPRRRAKRRSTK
jgi:hypothetical protein